MNDPALTTAPPGGPGGNLFNGCDSSSPVVRRPLPWTMLLARVG